MPTRPTETNTRSTQATLTFVVLDAHGRARRDVPIRYGKQGRAQSVVYSGAGGKVSVTVPGSTYTIDIPTGCWPKVRVFRAQRLRVGVVPGTRREVHVRVLEMQRRFTAQPPLSWTPEPPWGRNAPARLTFTLWDTCKERAAPATSFADLRFVPGAGLRVTDDGGMQTDDTGRATVVLACAAAGDPTLMFGDAVDAADRVDLLALRKPFSGAAWCA